MDKLLEAFQEGTGTVPALGELTIWLQGNKARTQLKTSGQGKGSQGAKRLVSETQVVERTREQTIWKCQLGHHHPFPNACLSGRCQRKDPRLP